MDNEYFVTDDTALAAFLYMKGMVFVEATLTNRNNPRRKKFIIRDVPERIVLEKAFYQRQAVVVPLDYHDARVAVSRFLKVTVDDPRPPTQKLVD
jgi:hypothetical protein